MIRRTLALQSARISCLEQGELRAGVPSLVLVHGLMGVAACFEPMLRCMDPGRHAVALDLPGAGLAQRGEDMPARLGELALVVEEALALLGVDRPVLAGHSHGGALGLQLAATRPGLLSGLVLLGPAHPYFVDADRLVAFYLSAAGKTFAHALPWLPAWMQRRGLQQMLGSGSFLNLRERLVPYRQNLRTPGTVPHLLHMLKSWHADREELRALLRQGIDMPTLVIWGDEDPVVPVATAAALLKRLGRAHLEVLPGTGHLPAEEEPNRCAQLIEQWSTRLRE